MGILGSKTTSIGLPDKTLLRPDEVANYFRVSPQVIYNWLKSGDLKGVRLGKKVLRVKKEEVLIFQNKSTSI